VNIWFSTNNNTKTDIIRETITYKKEIVTKTVVKDYLENTDDILARIIQHPTVTNAKIIDDTVQLDITFEIIAEIIGETKMKVTVFKETENWEEEVETLDMDINENFLG
jgi:spore coat protein E